MSDWQRAPYATTPTALQPEQVVPGVTLQSPKGTRWRVIKTENQGRGASYLLADERGVRQYRSFQNIRTWRVIEPS